MALAVASDTATTAQPPSTPYRVSVDQYRLFRSQGFLVVPALVEQPDVDELRVHVEDLMMGRLPEQAGHVLDIGDHSSGVATQQLAAPPEHLSPEEKAEFFLRIHMLHRQLVIHERYLLYPRILDVLQALIGPDLLALQTMLFLKGPGKAGQGWHQDSYYIPTHPDTLCGAWIAIDSCDEQNGAVWFATGSQHEPVYPSLRVVEGKELELEGLHGIRGASNPNDDENMLSPVANRYNHLLASANPGDVVFFAGHVLHRSKKNWSTDRFRRSFVGHYCNARSFTQWNDGDPADADPDTGQANHLHILARGNTHLPFAQPKFGTPCAATLSPEERQRQAEYAEMMMGDMDSGMMGAMPADPNLVDDD